MTVAGAAPVLAQAQPATTDGTAAVVAPVPPAPALDGCAELRARLTRDGYTGYAACVRDTEPTAVVPQFVQLPPGCLQPSRGWRILSRTEACGVIRRAVTIYLAPGFEVVGEVEYLESNYAKTSVVSGGWTQQIDILQIGAWGLGLEPGTAVSGDATCAKSCVLRGFTFPPQPVGLFRSAEGSATFDSTATGRGLVGDATTKFTYVFTNPLWPPTTPATAEPPLVRCDNALAGANPLPGCVFDRYRPVLRYSRDGIHPEVARHIGDAQASGLPGAYDPALYPDGRPLTRMFDAAQQTLNRSVSCPRARPRPPSKSCDEYPFASTRQGAAQPPLGLGRTFDWCDTADLPLAVVAPVGYCACMIDAVQNRLDTGTVLSVFYSENRVLDGDDFFVWITGTGGGPSPNPTRTGPVWSPV